MVFVLALAFSPSIGIPAFIGAVPFVVGPGDLFYFSPLFVPSLFDAIQIVVDEVGYGSDVSMLVIFGTYNFAKKPVAYRADYCRSCEGERLTLGVRSFDAFHLFWIPVLPLGFWTRWYCGQCQAHPHEADLV